MDQGDDPSPQASREAEASPAKPPATSWTPAVTAACSSLESTSAEEPAVAKSAAVAARARGLWNQQKPAAGRRVYGRQPLAQVGLG